MADCTEIEWTDATWNPIVGCSVVSPGCTNCYAMKMAARIEAMHEGTHRPHILAGGGPAPRSHYEGTIADSKAGAVWTGKVALAPEHILTQPLRWRRGRRIFVNSMGDLFHESLPDEWIDLVFAVMNAADWHDYQVLTKRSARMRDYMTFDRGQRIADAQVEMGLPVHVDIPARHIWLGVSAEDQRRADERVPDLLATPAAVRFVSAEPLLGLINFRRIAHGDESDLNALKGEIVFTPQHRAIPPKPTAKLDWVIVGGESGPSARPMHPDWARSIRDQCAAAGVPFFFKQWGSWHPELDRDAEDPDWRAPYGGALNDRHPDIAWLNLEGGSGFHGARFQVLRRIRKSRAGRLLDGQEHNGMPGGQEATP